MKKYGKLFLVTSLIAIVVGGGTGLLTDYLLFIVRVRPGWAIPLVVISVVGSKIIGWIGKQKKLPVSFLLLYILLSLCGFLIGSCVEAKLWWNMFS